MYGTIGQARIKDGKLAEVVEMEKTWLRERGPHVPGAIATYMFQSDNDPSMISVVALFRDRETYRANANDPDQDAWYQQLRAALTGDIVWHDGEVVVSGMLNGI